MCFEGNFVALPTTFLQKKCFETRNQLVRLPWNYEVKTRKRLVTDVYATICLLTDVYFPWETILVCLKSFGRTWWISAKNSSFSHAFELKISFLKQVISFRAIFLAKKIFFWIISIFSIYKIYPNNRLQKKVPEWKNINFLSKIFRPSFLKLFANLQI